MLFQHHGLECLIHNDWVLPNSTVPALRAIWYPGDSSGELQVQVLVRDQLIIEECFAGAGPGDTGLRDALVNFTANSFHVLLSALWDKSDPNAFESWPDLFTVRPDGSHLRQLTRTRASRDVRAVNRLTFMSGLQ